MPRRAPILRSTLVPHARYDAAGQGRRLAKWSPPSAGPNRSLSGLQKIRDRARDSSRNDWAGASGVQKWTTNLIGTGIVPRWTDRRLAPLWSDWVRDADADGVLDWYGMQALGVRTWLDGGEVFLRARWRDPGAPLAAPLQIQLLEPEMVPLLDTSAWPGMPDGNVMIQGIEFNKYGRRVAYWFYKQHPGDRVWAARPDPTSLVRVLATDVRHVFEPKRPGQVRGVSDLAPVLVRLRNTVDFEDAVLDRQKLANLFTLFITRQLPDKWLSELELDPLTGMPKVWDSAGNMMVGLEPGAAMELKPGENVQFANPPEAGTTYSDYMRTQHLGTAAGAGLPYELFAGDIQNVSDRTLRVVMNEFRRFAQQRQWHIIIPQMCQPAVEWWSEALALGGIVSPLLAEVARRPKHSPQGWEYIHPVQDVEGKVKAIEAGLVSRDQVISERGDDPIEVDDERKAAQDRAASLGLQMDLTVAAATAAGSTADPQVTNELRTAQILALQAIARPAPAPAAPAGPSATETILAGLMEMLPQLVARGDAASMDRAAELTGVLRQVLERPINVSVQSPSVTVHNDVPAQPAPEIRNEIVMPASEVSVPAPIVNINVPKQPAPVIHNEVTVSPHVDVNLPTRRTTTDITRDQVTGDITKVVQTEKTVE